MLPRVGYEHGRREKEKVKGWSGPGLILSEANVLLPLQCS